MDRSSSKYFCPRCLTSGKGYSWTCGVQNHSQDYLSCKKTRYPAKNSSKQRWKEFVAHLEDIWLYKFGSNKCEYVKRLRNSVAILKKTTGVK